MVYGKSGAASGALGGGLMTTTDPLFDPAIVEDPYAYYAELRENDPVHLLEGTSTYLVTRLDLIHQVVGDPGTFSSNTNAFLHLAADGTPKLRDALGDEPASGMSGRCARHRRPAEAHAATPSPVPGAHEGRARSA
jgi:cytochrome P450